MKKLHEVDYSEKIIILKDLKRLIKLLSRKVNFDSAILFGSFLNSNEFNDIDILLVKNKNLGLEDFLRLYSEIIKLNSINTFDKFYLTYYDSDNKPNGKIKISLELDTPFMKDYSPEFYERVFFVDKSFKVIYGNFDPNTYLDKNIESKPEKLQRFRKLIKFLHSTPSLDQLENFCKNTKS